MIIDAISIYHPTLREKLKKAEITSKENASIVMLTPIDDSIDPINQNLETMIKDQLEQAFDRFDEECEDFCDLNISSIRSLKRWFKRFLSPKNIRYKRFNPHKRDAVKKNIRESKGIHGAFIYRVST